MWPLNNVKDLEGLYTDFSVEEPQESVSVVKPFPTI